MTNPDKPLPNGSRTVPEVAAAAPRTTNGARAWTFRLRRGFRFSDGTPVRASAFERAIYRTLAPGIKSPGAQYTDAIVGAAAVQAGQTTKVAGVTARGLALTVRFTHPVPDFPAQTTMPFFCAVPPNLPPDPEGRAVFPSAGPYVVSEYRSGQRAVLTRNSHYGGNRPRHVDRFVIDLDASSGADVLDRIERGSADWGTAGPSDFTDPDRRLVAKYGINRAQFFVKPSLSLRAFMFNTSRGIFGHNVRLRQAVNFAVDRRAVRRATFGAGAIGSSLTDQYLPPSMPGFRDADIYPLKRPNLRKARSYAKGHRRGGKAVLYTFAFPSAVAGAQVIKQNLKRIGIDVTVTAVDRDSYFTRLREERYDLAFHPWSADYADPYGLVNLLLERQFIDESNLSRFDSPKYNRLLQRAARLQGSARYRAYGDLDVRLARDAAPILAIDVFNETTLVSKRVGCVVLRPTLDLAAVCLK